MEAISPSRGRQRALLIAVAAGVAACGSDSDRRGGRDPAAREPDGVRPGIEVLLADSSHLIAGRRLGLITNQTGVTREEVSSIDALYEAVGADLVALFSPEHGIRGRRQAGVPVSGSTDPETGLSIHSLYGETRRPTPEMLDGVQALLFDIQDVGARYYTYLSTMALAMEAAAEAGIRFIVLDRPNPIGGAHPQGTVLEPEHASFVGLYPIPMRHGMTAGELARLYNDGFQIGAELHVVPAQGWERTAWYDDTGLPWIPPSPNMPSLESAAHYPGTCLFEGTNLSVGRGTERAFQQIGAPWLDGSELARRLSARGLAGVRFEPVEFTPAGPGDGKFDGQTVFGVRFVVTDRTSYDPTVAGVAALLETRRLSGDAWTWRPDHFDRLAGNDRLRAAIEEGVGLETVVGGWGEQLRSFRRLREPYLIY